MAPLGDNLFSVDPVSNYMHSFNPFKPNHNQQIEKKILRNTPKIGNEPVPNFRGIAQYFSFFTNIYKTFCKQMAKILNAVSDLDLHWHMFHKQDAMLKIEFITKFVLQMIDNTYKVRKVAKIRNRYNQVPHLTQDTTCTGKVTKTQINKSAYYAMHCRSKYFSKQ